MNTIILMWNPSISSVNMHDYEQSMKNCIEEYFNWSVWDSGHSGQILEPKLADMLEDKWHKYIDENEAMFEDPEKAVRPRRGKAFLQISTHPVSPRRDRR